MPSIEISGLKQKAVYWAANGLDNFGKAKVDSPIEISVRWENTTKQIIGPNGSPINITAEVQVDRDLLIGSILWLGLLTDLPDSPTELREVVGFSKIPDDKGRKFERIATAMNYMNTLPASSSGTA